MKMKMQLTSGLLGIAALFIASHANAATVQINPASITVIDGAAFALTVEGATFAEATAGGGFQLTWDTAALSLASTEADIVASLGANGFDAPALVGGVLVDTVGGILQVAAGKFFEAAVAGTFDIATLNFLALAPGVTTTDLGIFALQPDWLDAGGINPLAEQPNYLGATVTVNPSVVPVPAAVWLFGSGLIGLVGIARRRSSAIA